MGVDYGEKRIGLALSDAQGHLAFPHATVGRIEDIFTLIQEEDIGTIVVGLPLSLEQEETAESRAVRAFARRLGESVLLPIVFESEIFTTKIAEAHSPRSSADASAAAIILQAYLDKKMENRK